MSRDDFNKNNKYRPLIKSANQETKNFNDEYVNSRVLSSTINSIQIEKTSNEMYSKVGRVFSIKTHNVVENISDNSNTSKNWYKSLLLFFLNNFFVSRSI